ncbi:unnamed protein product [Rotaria sp. Silwood2]|nr:unnamed protein product [Rotaria sp. Silwood2]CAF4394638.1 unnamed protein product [Rotaria sp. Silwood2]
MGFFLRDLHYQIEQLYSKMKNHDRLNVFRGQGVPLAEFDKMKNNEFSNFQRNENEILFSMHTVFRIVDLQEIEDRLWQINLIVTSDNDPILTNLTKYIRDGINGSTAMHRIGQLMIKMGKFAKAEEFYNILRR